MTRNATATERFDSHEGAIRALLELIRSDVEKHRREFTTTGGRDWGYVGSLAELRELLQRATNFMNGTDED